MADEKSSWMKLAKPLVMNTDVEKIHAKVGERMIGAIKPMIDAAEEREQAFIVGGVLGWAIGLAVAHQGLTLDEVQEMVKVVFNQLPVALAVSPSK